MSQFLTRPSCAASVLRVSSSMSSSMSFPSSIRAITTKFPQFKVFSSLSKPLISFLPHPSSLPFAIKSITFQRLPTKPQSLSPSSSSSSSPSLQSIEDLPPKLQDIVKLFQATEDPRAKYQQLLFYANNLSPPLDDKYKTKDNKVEGCVSQVWVRAYLDPDNNVYYEADSDSIMTKGLAALLVKGLSGRPVSEILQVSPDFVTLLGLHQNLTPSRNNGFLNMLKLMQRKALFLGLQADKDEGNPVSESSSIEEAEIIGANGSSGTDSSNLDMDRSENDINGSGSGGGGGLGLGMRGQRIREKLERELKAVKMQVEDISYQHAGHMGSRGSDGETHFNLMIVSKEFEGKSLVKRHRMIYGLLQHELDAGLHALSIIAKTPSEVEEEDSHR